MNYKNISKNLDAIAVIGMSGIFPEANTINKYWDNLIKGKESIVQFNKKPPKESELSNEDDFVTAASIVEDIDCFDAKFFNYSAYEAEIIDPQQRLFLQCCWNALEDAGYCPDKAGNVGVFAGSNISTYLLMANPSLLNKEDNTYLLQLLMGNDKDYLSTRVSYKLNLTGPSVCVQSACSTSLLSIHIAAQSLLNGECEMALAGGVNISIPQKIDYDYKEGMIFSPDGHCRAFDAKAKGIVPGNGLGVVLLKPLANAISDGDSIDAVILGSAVNNDGANKIGYTAPSVEGQSKVIAEAIALADISVDSINYIETHGTGTILGDPIEVRALTQVFQNETKKTSYCALGSVKTNIGHLNSAAGVAGFIKTVLSLKHAKIPPSLHYTTSNPEIDFPSTPFFVNNKASLWPETTTPRRAGVSSFGFGGTNVHIVLEQGPEKINEVQSENEDMNLIVLSAQSKKQLRVLAKDYTLYLENNKDQALKSISFTTIVGRKHHNERVAIVAQDNSHLQEQLQNFINEENVLGAQGSRSNVSKIACLFTGQGSGYANMAKKLYDSNKTFHDTLDLCAKHLEDLLDTPLLDILFGEEKDTNLLNQTQYAQPALFAVEYSLYHMWIAIGVKFTVLTGHSVGEIVAACVAEVFSLKDGLTLISERGRLIQGLDVNYGGMLVLFANEEIVSRYVSKYPALSIAAINGPEHFVLSGKNTVLEELIRQLSKDNIEYTKLNVSHAFHSALLDPILDEFENLVDSFTLRAPKIPIVSNLYGRIVEDSEIITSNYWREHMRQPVQFMSGITALEDLGIECFLECGPHPTLINMSKRCVKKQHYKWIHSLHRNQDDNKQVLLAAAQLYCYGVDLQWGFLNNKTQYQRISLPTYPFEKKKYWLDSVASNLEKKQKNEKSYTWENIISAGNKQAIKASSDLDIDRLKRQEKLLISLSQTFIIKALRELGLFNTQEKKYSLEKLTEKVTPSYHQLLERLVKELVADGLLTLEKNLFMNLKNVDDTEFNNQLTLSNSLAIDNPAFLSVFINAGNGLANVLKGKEKAINAMMMGTSLDSAHEIYSGLPTSHYFNSLLREVVKSWTLNMPENKALRILEIGSGTGATSEQLLLLLPKNRSTYYYTDVSPLFLQRASKKFKSYDFVEYKLFDINKSPKQQGFDYNSFDLIVASNVLHAADDLAHTMKNVSKLLKPNGMLFMYEIVKETLIGEITTGLLMPLIKDTKLRGIEPFMSKTKWQSLLMDLGLKNFHSLPEDKSNTSFLGERVLLAQKDDISSNEDENKNYFHHVEWDLNDIEVQDLESLLEKPYNWVIFSDKTGYTEELTLLLKKKNNVNVISLDKPFELMSKQLKEIFSKDKPVQLIYLRGLDNKLKNDIQSFQLQEQQAKSCLKLLEVLSALSEIDINNLTNLSIVTNGTQHSSAFPNKNIALSQSLLWGFSQVVALGHPELRVKLIDLDSESSKEKNSKFLLQNLLNKKNGAQYQLVLRNNDCYLPRIKTLPNTDFTNTPPKIGIDSKGWYVIAGGLGGLGIKTAAWLVKEGAKKILLIGRSKPSASAKKEIDTFINQGVHIKVAQVDITKYKELKSLLDGLNGPVKGIIHSAVVQDFETLGTLPQEQRTLAVISPKLEGAWNLHMITKDYKELDMFILYSSSVSLIPARGLPEYVASNAFLDALSHYRRAAGLPALSINWGAWAEVGTVANINQQQQLKKNGLNSMGIEQSFNYLQHIIEGNFKDSHIGIFDIDWNKLLKNHPKEQINSYFKDVYTSSYEHGQNETKEDSLLQYQLLKDIKESNSSKEILEFTIEYLKQKISFLLQTPLDKLSIDANLFELGIDSLMLLDLLNNLNLTLKIKLKPNELMADLNIREISQKILDAMKENKFFDMSEVLIIDKASTNIPFPLTHIQQAYWIGREEHMDLGNIACHGYIEIDCEDLDIPLLENAWNLLIQRHEMLRCVILPHGEQQILEEVPFYHFNIKDLSRLSDKDYKEELEKTRTKLSHRVPSASTWPLIEIYVSILKDKTTRLHVSIDNIMTDGRSIGIILSEWVYFYNNNNALLPKLELSFRDYIMSLEAYKQNNDYAEAKDYWMSKLNNIYPSPQLPLTKKISDISSPKFSRKEFHLTKEKWEKLKYYGSKKASLTPSGILLSAYSKVLECWSKSSKFTLNIPTFSRLPLHPQVNDIVGEFTSIILLSVDFSKKLAFKDHARILQEQLLKDQSHDIFSGVEVIRELVKYNGSKEKVNMPVVFTSTFGLSEKVNTTYSDHENESKGLGREVYTISQTPQVYIDNHVHDYRGSLNVYWDCVDELFPEGLTNDMFNAYTGLLESLATSEDAWDAAEPISLPKEQVEQRTQYNNTENIDHLPKKDDLLSGFLTQVKKHPNNVALITNNEKLTYNDLYNRSIFIASKLKYLDVKSLANIAVILPKGWQQISSVIATLGMNAVYVPFDYNLPEKRIFQLLEIAKITHIITSIEMHDGFKWPNHIKVISVPSNWSNTEEKIIQNLDIRFTTSDNKQLAYVLYTSGTTGNPKGVMISHSSALNTILNVNDKFKITSDDVVFGLSSLNFDLSVYDIFGTFSAGASLVLPNNDAIKDPAHWIDLILEHNISVWDSVPALCQMMLLQADAKTGIMESLRLVLLSGDWIPLNLKDSLAEHTKNVELVSLGGATEASIWSIYYPINKVSSVWKSIPYGMPLANQKFYVLDDKLNACPNWVVGDLYIGGEGLSLGYWQNDEQSRESFITHSKMGKLYRTGDIGYFNPEGYIEFLGRNDFQVKINGHRIELCEIETSLLEHKFVTNAVVTAIDSYGSSEASNSVKNNKQQLLAYCVVKPNELLDVKEELKTWIEERLPSYMVPNHFFLLETIPLTQNGKLNRAVLPLPNNGIQNDFLIEAETKIEKLLVSLCKDILSVKNLGMNSNFFDVGGDSLLGTKLSILLQQRGINLSVRDIFINPVLGDMVSTIEAKEHIDIKEEIVLIEFNESSNVLSSLTAIDNNKANLFCIHGSDGGIFVFNELANQLSYDFNVYGISAQSPTEYKTISDIASSYIEQIQKHQTSQPSFICGFSSGGFIACDIVKQLQEIDKKDSKLILIDTHLIAQEFTNKPLIILALFAYTLNMSLEKLPIDITLMKEVIEKVLTNNYEKGILNEIKDVTHKELERLLDILYDSNSTLIKDNKSLHNKFKVFRQHFESSANYNIEYLPNTDVLLLLAKENINYNDAWDKLSDKMNYVEIKGKHSNCLQHPYVSGLANNIRKFAKSSQG